MGAAIVKLTNAESFPGHGCTLSLEECVEARKRTGGWKEWRGRPIKVILPPVKPTHFRCGTPVVWKVHPDTLKAMYGDMEVGNIFVCIHQIEAD